MTAPTYRFLKTLPATSTAYPINHMSRKAHGKSNMEQTSNDPRPYPSAIIKPARLARTEPTKSRAKLRASPKASPMESKRPAYTGRVTRSRAAQAATLSALDPSLQSPVADSKPQSQPTGNSSQNVIAGSGATARRAARGKKKTGSEVSDGKPHSTEKGANEPIQKRKIGRQKEQEDEEAEGEPSARPPVESDAAATGTPATGRIPPRANNSPSGIHRPKASDFYDTPDTSVNDGGEPYVAVIVTQEHQGQIASEPDAPPLKTPPMPWDLYDISDKPVDSTGSKQKAMAGKAGQKDKGKSTRKGKVPAKPTRGISRHHVARPWLKDSASVSPEQKVAPPLIAEQTGLDEEAETDPHDREMDEDYIPISPGPMPRVPKLLKGPRKRPTKRRSLPLVPGDAAETAVISDAEENPKEPVPAPPPPAARPLTPVAEANPEIWNVDPQSIVKHGRRAFLARPGSVYCEVCFRDEVARWIRFRRSVVRILHLLGEDSALQEMCDLWQEVEGAEKDVIHEQVMRQSESCSRKRLKSPPPPERVPTAGLESEDERDRQVGKERKGEQVRQERGRISAKKFIIVSDHGPPTAAPHFHEYPSDVVGLVLLRVLAERPRANLNQAQREEVKGLLADSRQEIGMDLKLFGNLTSYCKWILVRGRTVKPKADVSEPSDPRRWWWEFDDALQIAYQRLPAAPQPPSSFAETLARKAGDAANARLTAGEDATARGGGPRQHGTERLARIQQALGMGMPDNLFLKSIGDRIAQAKLDLENDAQTTVNKNDKRPGSPEDQDASHLPTPKRYKPNNHPSVGTAATSQAPNVPSAYQVSPPLVDKKNEKEGETKSKPLLHLPCQNCAESLAFHYRRRHPYSATYYDDGDDEKGEPWIKPLMWTFRLDMEAAARVRTVDEFVSMLAAEPGRRMQTQTIAFPGPGPVSRSGSGVGTSTSTCSGTVGDQSQSESKGQGQEEGQMMKVMMDITAGETRVVIVEMMRGVFDVLCGRFGKDTSTMGSGSGDGDREEARSRRKVRFEPGPVVMRRAGPARPVGMWETWKNGRLEGYRMI